MKNMFKLAAIAVSMVLAMSFIACSSGDDVVDATTPEYLWTARCDSRFASLKYDQNVTDKEIKSLEDAYKGITTIGDGCAGCLDQYFVKLFGGKIGDENVVGIFEDFDDEHKLDSDDITASKTELGKLKTEFGAETYHKVNVYKPAIEKAIGKLYKAEVEVDDIKGIVDSKLNERQSTTMSAYLDAAAALKAALSEDDADKCETTIKAADTAIENFNKLEKVATTDIKILTTMVGAMATDIQTKIVNKIN